jgi:hypothetical protein
MSQLPRPPIDHPNEKEHRRTLARILGAAIAEEGLPHRWGRVHMSALEGRLRGVADPTLVQVQTDGAGSIGVYSMGFSNTAQQELFFAAQLPHSFAQGADLKPMLHWAPSDAGGGRVIWGIEYSWANMAGAFPLTKTLEVTSTAVGSLAHISVQLGVMTASGFAIASGMLMRVYRKAADVNDDYSATAIMLGVALNIEHDTRGSYAENNKWAE